VSNVRPSAGRYSPVSNVRASAGRRAASRFLHELLAQQGPYRRLWEREVVRARPGEINQLAVAQVLARYLWSHPRATGDADALPRQLKDTVARALSGALLSRQTLTLFIDAFGISGEHADRLWRLWEGSGRISVLSGPRAMGAKTEEELRSALGSRRHQTVSMHDHVYVGPDGRIARTRTLQVVEALVDGLNRIPYLYDTNALTLEVGLGCGDVSGEVYQISDHVYAATIPLARELSAGETTSLEYVTTYSYPGNLADPHEREARRAVMRRWRTSICAWSSTPRWCRRASGGQSGTGWTETSSSVNPRRWAVSMRCTAISGPWKRPSWGSSGRGGRRTVGNRGRGLFASRATWAT